MAHLRSKQQKTQRIKQLARELGFDKVGIVQAGETPRASYLEKWLARGNHGQMEWMERHKALRKDMRKFFPEAKSIIMVALNYYTPFEIKDSPHTAKISRYAWGRDYHKILRKKLKTLFNQIKEFMPRVNGRIFVDSAPVMEKQWAVEAGLGWQGKNTNIITRDLGSWIFLGGMVINQELEADRPIQDYCGSCNACVQACPTNALEPYVLDATRCISYLTIEHKEGSIPNDLAQNFQNWVFGCDICQDVCPWNRFAQKTAEPQFEPRHPAMVNPPLHFLMKLTKEEFENLFAGTPVRRAHYQNFKRNVQIVWQNNKAKLKVES